MTNYDRMHLDPDDVMSAYKNLEGICPDIISAIERIEQTQTNRPTFAGQDANSYFEGLSTACNNLRRKITEFNETSTTIGKRDVNTILDGVEQSVSTINKQNDTWK